MNETKNCKQTLSSYNRVGWWKLLIYFPGWEYFMRRVFEWDHWQASKDNSHASCQRIGDAHVGDGGVSDDGKNGKPPFWDNVSVSILGLLLFEYISICEITLKESL